MKRSHRSVRSALLPLSLSGLLALSALAAVAEDRRGEQEIKPLIVMIKSVQANGDDEIGAGIIFGQKGNRLYIVTANHVVRQGVQEAKSVHVRFRWLPPDEDAEAKLLSDWDAQSDWAVLKVDNVDGLPPEGLPFAQLGETGSLKRGDRVFLIGNPTGHPWDLTVTPDGVTSKTATSIFFESVHLEPGHSGGALLDEHLRVAGLLKSSQAPHGEAVNLSAVLDDLRERGYPVSLKPGEEASRAVPPSTPPVEKRVEDPNDVFAAKGQAIANSDSVVAAIREREPAGASRRGFDIGMAVCEGHTAWGPGKQKVLDSLSPAEQIGFNTARNFSLERNNNMDLARAGAAIAERDPVVAAARAREPAGLYWLGFDIATGIFGDPALGAKGNTATGPGSLGIRDKLSPEGQRGFNASVAFHLNRNYRR